MVSAYNDGRLYTIYRIVQNFEGEHFGGFASNQQKFTLQNFQLWKKIVPFSIAQPDLSSVTECLLIRDYKHPL